ncbi:MAG: EAL domain-containing protein [Nocardioides sp.]
MVPKLWLYVLAVALAADLLLSAANQVSGLVAVLTGATQPRELVAAAGLVATVAAVVAGIVVARALLRARTKLDHHEQILEAAAATSDEWQWESDLDGVLTYSSPGVTALLGRRPDEVVGRSVFELLHDDGGTNDAHRMLAKHLSARSGWQDAVLCWQHRDGTPVMLHGSAMAITDPSGQVVGYRGARRPAADGARSHQDLAERRDRIDAVLATQGVTMALQPLVSLVTGEVSGVEALARFRDGRGPDQWFADAQACGRAKELDELTFTAALAHFDGLPESVYLSVNASPELLVDASFRQRLVESGVPLDRLFVEITEHARVADYPALNVAVASLREAGVRFAIDDTGAGYASLNHVLQLRPETIKLDRALIDGVDTDPARRSLVTALVLLALEIGAAVTGEGVETDEQLSALSTLGVDQAQGYLLARPSTDRGDHESWWHRRWVCSLAVER